MNPYATIAQRLGGRLVRRWPLKGGVSSAVEAIEVQTEEGLRRYVVRRCGDAEWKPGHAQATANEHALLQVLHEAGFAVPAVYALDTTGALLPAPYLVMDYIEGTTEIEPSASALDAMAAFLADLHRLDPDQLELPQREDPIEGARTYLPSVPGAQAAQELLLGRGPLQQRRAVLHGDFWPGNIIWRDGRIAAVIDWEDAAIGDPMCDLAGARLELLFRHGTEVMSAFTQRYAEKAPVDDERLPLWELFVASASAAYMHQWGLDASVEAQMRADAARLIQDAIGRL